MKSIEELSQTSKDTSIQKLREEFNKKSFHNENHPPHYNLFYLAKVSKRLN